MVGGSEGVIFILRDFEITVEKLVYGGDGLGRLDGRAVLAPFVLPGERVRVAATAQKPGLLHASLLEVQKAAPERIAPACPYFGRCGGCHYQHAPYELQLALKRAILEDQLRRIGKIAPPAEIGVVAGEPWGYRNRVQLHIAGTELGYRAAQSHQLCPIENCPISSPAINAAIAVLREMLRDPRWPRFIRVLEVFTNETQVQINVLEAERPVARRFFEWCAARVPGFVSGALDYSAAGHTWRVSSGSFFQVNRFLIDGLVDGHGGVGDDVFVVEVGDDTDDAARVIADADEFHDAVGPAHGAADGFLAGEEVVGDALADDDDAVGSVFVGVAEVTAFEEGDAEGGEVSRRDRAEVGAEVFACVFAGGTFDGKGKADDECLGVAPGNAESGGDAADARESGDAADDVVVEVLHLLGRAAVRDDGEIDGEDV